MEKYMKVQFKANLENVSLSRGVVSCFLFEENLTIGVLNEIKTIVSEAVTNAIVHGYHQDNQSIVTLVMSLDDNILKLVIEDYG